MAQTNYDYHRAQPPTREEIAFFENQLRTFVYRPPTPAATSEAGRRGWGFHPHLAPPIDCYEFIAAHVKRQFDQRLTEPLRPEVRYSLLTILMAYFAWLRTEEGTRWLLAIYGIFIVPAHPGYAYFYESERLLEPQFGLRIYQIDRHARTLHPPEEFYGPKLIDKMKELLESHRDPNAREPCRHASEGMWKFVGGWLRNWLAEPKADLHWPTSKPDRFSGYAWAKGLMRFGSETERVWNVIGFAENILEGRLYRIQRPAWEERFVAGVVRRVPPEKPGVIWSDRQKIRAVPLDDLDKHLTVPLQTIEARYKCQSCGHLRSCTAAAAKERLCMNCRGTQLESDERPSLNWCRYRECRACPQYLRTNDDLVNLRSSLNYSSDRVRRS